MPDPAAHPDVQDGNYYAVGTGPTPNGPFVSGQVCCQHQMHVMLTQIAQGLVEYAALPAQLRVPPEELT